MSTESKKERAEQDRLRAAKSKGSSRLDRWNDEGGAYEPQDDDAAGKGDRRS